MPPMQPHSAHRRARPSGATACWGLLLLLSAIVGCSGQATQTPSAGPPVELELKTSTGEWLSLSSLRGRPTLLFLFATYDSASQLLWAPITLVRPDFPTLQLVAVALQPDAERLLPMYGESLGIRDPLASDDGEVIRGGESSLGPIAAIPTLILIGPDGREQARRTGATSSEALHQWLDEHL